MVMCSTDESERECVLAIRRIAFKRKLSEGRIELDVARLNAWKDRFALEGLWRRLPELQASADEREAVSFHWRSYRTDPDDEYLAMEVVLHGLDALFSANMTVIADKDWSELVRNLGMSGAIPRLCR